MNTIMIISIQVLLLLLFIIILCHYLAPIMKKKNVHLHIKTGFMEFDLET